MQYYGRAAIPAVLVEDRVGGQKDELLIIVRTRRLILEQLIGN